MFVDKEGSPPKPERLAKIERDSVQQVEFDNGFGEWMVYIKGHLADFEAREISNALRAANKAGRGVDDEHSDI